MSTVADSSTSIDLAPSHGPIDWMMSHGWGILAISGFVAYGCVAAFNREHRDLYIALFNALVIIPLVGLTRLSVALFNNLVAIPIVEHRWLVIVPIIAPIVATFMLPRDSRPHRIINAAPASA